MRITDCEIKHLTLQINALYHKTRCDVHICTLNESKDITSSNSNDQLVTQFPDRNLSMRNENNV